MARAEQVDDEALAEGEGEAKTAIIMAAAAVMTRPRRPGLSWGAAIEAVMG